MRAAISRAASPAVQAIPLQQEEEKPPQKSPPNPDGKPLGTVLGVPPVYVNSLKYQVPWAFDVADNIASGAKWTADRAGEAGDVVVNGADAAVDAAEEEVQRRLKEPTKLRATRPAWAGYVDDEEDDDSVYGSEECDPKCGWHCGPSPVCNQVCEPVCAPPECRTLCGRSPESCETRCGAPQCAVICPQTQPECKGEDGEGCGKKCRTVCSPPVCTTECGDDCRNVCEKPLCSWKCHWPKCPKPKCNMTCTGFASCTTKFRVAGNVTKPPQPYLDEDMDPNITYANASLDPSILTKVMTPPPKWKKVFVVNATLDPMVIPVPSTPPPLQAPAYASSGRWPFLAPNFRRFAQSPDNPGGFDRLKGPPRAADGSTKGTLADGLVIVAPSHHH